MTILFTILIILYCVVGAIFNLGIWKEYQNDLSGELDSFSPGFVKLMVVSVAILWPLMVTYHLYLQFKNKNKEKV